MTNEFRKYSPLSGGGGPVGCKASPGVVPFERVCVCVQRTLNSPAHPWEVAHYPFATAASGANSRNGALPAHCCGG